MASSCRLWCPAPRPGRDRGEECWGQNRKKPASALDCSKCCPRHCSDLLVNTSVKVKRRASALRARATSTNHNPTLMHRRCRRWPHQHLNTTDATSSHISSLRIKPPTRDHDEAPHFCGGRWSGRGVYADAGAAAEELAFHGPGDGGGGSRLPDAGTSPVRSSPIQPTR